MHYNQPIHHIPQCNSHLHHLPLDRNNSNYSLDPMVRNRNLLIRMGYLLSYYHLEDHIQTIHLFLNNKDQQSLHRNNQNHYHNNILINHIQNKHHTHHILLFHHHNQKHQQPTYMGEHYYEIQSLEYHLKFHHHQHLNNAFHIYVNQ